MQVLWWKADEEVITEEIKKIISTGANGAAYRSGGSQYIGASSSPRRCVPASGRNAHVTNAGVVDTTRINVLHLYVCDKSTRWAGSCIAWVYGGIP